MTTEERVAKIFQQVLGIEPSVFSPRLSHDQVLTWDSLGHIKIVEALEDEFRIEFDLDETMNMNSVGDIIQMLSQKIGRV